jgi:hypothetical protein
VQTQCQWFRACKKIAHMPPNAQGTSPQRIKYEKGLYVQVDLACTEVSGTSRGHHLKIKQASRLQTLSADSPLQFFGPPGRQSYSDFESWSCNVGLSPEASATWQLNFRPQQPCKTAGQACGDNTATFLLLRTSLAPGLLQPRETLENLVGSGDPNDNRTSTPPSLRKSSDVYVSIRRIC